MTKQEILEMTGLSEQEFYQQYPTQEAFEMAMGGMVDEYKKGGWIQKATASIKKRGTEGVCTGSNFGGPSCRPGTKRYALAKTFRKMAKARKKEEGGMVDMYAEGGKLPESILRSRLESHMSPAEAQDYIDSYEQGGEVEMYGKGGYTVRRSNDRKGKTHVVTGPDGTKKYFGDPNMGERGKSKNGKKAFYARHAKNLKNNPYFRAYARATWEDGGMVASYGDGGQLPVDLLEARMKASGASQDEINSYKAQHYAEGGVVDVYQLMGMPTPDMYEMGGYAMMEDYGRGGMIKRKDGSYSKRGLWDNIRANKGSGKKPTKEMLKQERKIRAAEKKEYGGMVDAYGMGGTTKIGDLSHVISMQNHSNMGMAMGGAINGPNLLQIDTGNMPTFAMSGMTGQPTQINVEKGELLTDKNGKIVTEYKGGGMVPHPEEGIDERGTVPAQEGMFVITKRMADKYKKAMKNHDKLYADTIRNNIAFDRQKKEAAEEQAAMTAYDKFTAKYGGAVQRMYARGGMVPMYQNGAVTRAMQNAPMSPFLANLFGPGNTTAAPAASAPAARPYNSNVTMSPGLAQNVANFVGTNDFYRTGPNYTPNPGTTGSRSVQDIMRGVQPSPFFQNITRNIQPSPFLQRGSSRPATQPTPSNATSAGRYTAPSRPTYTAPTNTGATAGRTARPARPVTARPAPAAMRTPAETMTMAPMRGISDEQVTGLASSLATPRFMQDNFDLGNVGGAERMYETTPPGAEQQVPAMGTQREYTGDELFGDTDAQLTPEQRAARRQNRMDNLLMAGQFLPAAYNLGRGIFEKAWKPGSYETPADLKWEDLTGEAGRRDMFGAYAANKYNARQIGGSNALAALQSGTNAYQQNLAAYEEALENRNKAGRAKINQLNKTIQQSNMQMRMNRDYLAQQAREKKAEMIGAGIGNIGQASGQLWQNKQMMDALRMAYPENQNR